MGDIGGGIGEWGESMFIGELGMKSCEGCLDLFCPSVAAWLMKGSPIKGVLLVDGDGQVLVEPDGDGITR